MREKINKLFEITQSSEMAQLIVNSILDSLPDDIPQEFRDKFKAGIDYNEFTDLMALVYEKHFTEDDMDELIKFYSSDFGRRYSQMMPVVTQDCMAVGQQWGAAIAQRIMDDEDLKNFI